MEDLSRREVLATWCLSAGTLLLAAWRWAGVPRERPPALEPIRVDLERASLDELCAIPGIGPASAQALVAARPLRRWSQVEGVLGSRRAAKIAPYVAPLPPR